MYLVVIGLGVYMMRFLFMVSLNLSCRVEKRVFMICDVLVMWDFVIILFILRVKDKLGRSCIRVDSVIVKK